MKIVFTDEAWEDYLYWQKSNKRFLKRINLLIKEAIRSPYEGLGKPEVLRYDLQGFCSRRVDSEHRLVYLISNKELKIVSCRYHY